MFNNKPSGKPAATTTAAKTAAPSRGAMSSSVPSILAGDLVITGDIKTDGEVQIDGRLDGNVVATAVMIGEKGSVNGKVTASRVSVRGKVTGKIDAGSVELLETANVQADIIQDHLIIANGAFFDGKCSRKSGSAATKPKAS